MLSPQDRNIYLDALQPPTGYKLDRAIGTTFSLDLSMLISVPLGFAMMDCSNSSESLNDPVTILHTMRSYADRITLFCQSGRIAKPGKPHILFSYLESMVVEVSSSDTGGVFHPKTWLIRYTCPDEPVIYRFLCLSRNLTPDRSWDTILTLEGKLTKGRVRAYSKNHPLGKFIESLPTLSKVDIDENTVASIEEIAKEVRKVDFESPESFNDFEFIPLGFSWCKTDTLKRERVDKLLVISPFLSQKKVGELVSEDRGDILISKAEELDKISREVLEKFKEIYTIADDVQEEECDELDASPDEDEFNVTDPEISGLHAKLLIAHQGWDSTIWTGSPNATDAGYGRNIEFQVALRGKKSRMGIDIFLNGPSGYDGFLSMLEPYSIPNEPSLINEEYSKNEKAVEDLRNEIINTNLSIDVLPGKVSSSYCLNLKCIDNVGWNNSQAAGQIWPITLNESLASSLSTFTDEKVAAFDNCSFQAITTFIAFELVAGEGKNKATTRFVLNLPLKGAPEDRFDRILFEILKEPGQIIKYILYLLSLDDETGNDEDGKFPGVGGTSWVQFLDEDSLFEPLVKALAKEPGQIDAVYNLLEDIKKTEEGKSLLPENFDKIWDPVWEARERIRNEE